MSGTVKVYEIAEELKLDTELVLQKILALGIQAKNKMSKVDAGLVDQIKSSLAKDRQASYVEVEVAPGVRKLKRVEPPPAAKPARPMVVDLTPKAVIAPPPKPAAPAAPAPVAEKAPEPAVQARPAVPEKAPEPAAPPVAEKAPEPVAPPAPAAEERPAIVPAAPRPPADMPKPEVVAQASRPSQPPPKPDAPKRGIAVWDQATKQVIWMPSDVPAARPSTPMTPTTRRREVTPAPPSRTSKPGPRPITPNRPGPHGPRDLRASTPAQQPSTVDPKRRPVIKIEQQISLQELARRMNLKATEVLMKLLHVGGAGKNINSTLDADTATLLASEFGFTVEDVKLDTDAIIKKALPPDTVQDSSPRPPVVTVMGHVDHGKTTLLDAILGMRVAEGEAGGITQEVRAYRVTTPKGPVVFFDTPGHEAFTELRSRGAQATDVAVLVVAADDGVMPTTIEAINHVKAAKVPIVVALNKMDKPDANPDKVIRELMEQGVVPSEYGGDTLVVKVSAKQRQGIDELLETLAFQTDYLGLKANAKKAGVGTVFESKLDKGRGAVARVLVQEGIIHNGDVVLVGSAAGASWGRIRAMFDDRGKAIEKAGPSTPVEILGLSDPPNAGDKIYVCVDARKAQEAAEQIKAAVKKAPGQRGPLDIGDLIRAGQSEKVTIHAVIKADAQGAVEGLKKALTELSTDKVEVKVLHAAVGAITETDVQLAVSARAVIIGFNVRPAGKAAALAEEQKIAMRFYNVIYEAVDDVKLLMVGQLKPTLVEKALGKAEVRQVFNITKVGTIAGCMVLDGLIRRGAQMRLVRDGAQVWEGKIGSVRRVKEDVAEVKQGFECGIGLENTPAIKAGDIIEAFETEEVAARL